jgi:hypothetical protein
MQVMVWQLYKADMIARSAKVRQDQGQSPDPDADARHAASKPHFLRIWYENYSELKVRA